MDMANNSFEEEEQPPQPSSEAPVQELYQKFNQIEIENIEDEEIVQVTQINEE